MAAGRPAKPQELKILQGTDRADRTNPTAPQYPKIKTIPAVPVFLKKKKGASELWRRICGMLKTVGLLDQVNIDLIEMYVREVMVYREANKFCDDNGIMILDAKTGEPKANPARRIASDAMKNLMAIAREFGFTPSTRQKIKTQIENAPTPPKRKNRKQTALDVAQEMEL